MEDVVAAADLRARRPEAIERLVRENTAPLFHAALGLGFRESDAEELVQDVFVAFLEAAPRFEGHSTPRTFLFGILYNKSSNLRRRRLKEVSEDEVDARYDGRFNAWGIWSPKPPEQAALDSELKTHLEECAGGLSEDQRLAFYLREVEGESTDSLCNILGVSGTNLRVILFRARNKLRDCLEARWGGPR
ncbi:MAG: sigma-70 family RNA polymerase sigma factor [Elusimicrobia bacterium]|nr:sigma-70 family RNA polymerase sigma factor [Elusimicrobiota bacterium]